MKIDILKTESHHKDFQKLVYELDLYLAEIDGEDHSFYAQYNKLDAIKNCIIIYIDKEPIACGAYKKYDDQTIEVKKECLPKKNIEEKDMLKWFYCFRKMGKRRRLQFFCFRN